MSRAAGRSREPSIESVLDALRRAPGQAARKPRAAIEAAVAQLLRSANVPPPGGRSRGAQQYRVDDLARAAGTTTRNVRAYQERGLLHPPRRVGRVALFDESHLARLKIITSMLDRGYTSAHIAELLTAWEHGNDLSDVLGLERLVRPWAADQATTMTLREIRELAGDPASLERLIADKLVELHGTKAIVHRPELLQAFAEMRSHGMAMADVVALHERLAPMLDEISRLLVEAGARHVAATMQLDQPLTDVRVEELVTMLLRFRTLAMDSVTATLAHSIEARIEKLLGDYLAHLAGSAPVEDAG